MKFEIINSLTEFNRLKAEWRDLFSQNDKRANIFASFDWHRAVLATYQPNYDSGRCQLAIVVGRRRGQIELICPLVLTKRLATKVLTWIGDPVSQYGDVIAKPGDARPYLIGAAMKFAAQETGADALVLERVRTDSAINTTLQRTNPVVLQEHKAPFVSFSNVENADQFVAGLSAGRRKKQRRLWRRLCELAPATVETFDAGPRAVQVTRQVLELKSRMLAQQGTFSRAFADPYFMAFFESLAADQSADVGFKVSVLKSGDNLVAAEIGFMGDDNYIAHVGVYDIEYSKYAPGHLLMERTVGDCINAGIDTYDFLAPEDSYKLKWSTGSARVIDYGIPLTMTGHLYCSMLKLRGPAAVIAKKVLPASLVRYASHK